MLIVDVFTLFRPIVAGDTFAIEAPLSPSVANNDAMILCLKMYREKAL